MRDGLRISETRPTYLLILLVTALVAFFCLAVFRTLLIDGSLQLGHTLLQNFYVLLLEQGFSSALLSELACLFVPARIWMRPYGRIQLGAHCSEMALPLKSRSNLA